MIGEGHNCDRHIRHAQPIEPKQKLALKTKSRILLLIEFRKISARILFKKYAQREGDKASDYSRITYFTISWS